MDDIVNQFQANLNTHFNRFLIHVSKRYRVNLKQLFADFEKYQSGDLEVLQDTSPTESPKRSPPVGKNGKKEPVKTAKVIKDLIGEDDSISDEQSEVKTKVKKLNAVIDSSDDGTKSTEENDDEETVSLNDEKDEETVSLNDDKDEETVSLSEEDEEEIDLNNEPENYSNSDEPLPKTKNNRVIIQEPLSDEEDDEDDEPSESEPKPKVSKKGSKGEKKTEKKVASKKAEKKDSKGAAKGQKSIDDLSDKPRTPTEVKIPKGTQFLKGTNLVVVKGKVVAAVGKNGFTKLNARNLKSFETPAYADIKYDVWEKDKIEKKFSS